jgi:uncharacterized protein (TIGR00369 family)
MSGEAQDFPRPWLPAPIGRFVGRGHPAGDFLEAHEWRVLEHEPGRYRVEAHLLDRVKNHRGHLYGGFTPTYVDLVGVRTAQTLFAGDTRGMATVNMRVDYFEPVTAERFAIESRVVNSRGRTHLVEVTFEDLAGTMLVFSLVTLRQRV